MNKMRSLIQWYSRWRGCGYRDLYRLVYGDERVSNNTGLTGEVNKTREYASLLKSRCDELLTCLEKIKALHVQDEKFQTDCVSACKEGYPCEHSKIVNSTRKKAK